MSGTFKFFWNAEGVLNGVALNPWGNPNAPVREVAFTGNETHIRTAIAMRLNATAPQPDPVLLWQYDDMHQFEELIVQIRTGEGYVRLAWLNDKAVSSTDLSAAGTHQGCNHAELSCFTPFILNTDEATVFPNAQRATAHGLDGDSLPTILTDFTNGVRGRTYKLWAINTSTTADVPIDIYGRN